MHNTNMSQSTQNATVVRMNDRTPPMFQHSDEQDTAGRTQSQHPGWRGRSAGGYQSNGLGARRTSMNYNAGVAGVGSWFTDIRDAVTSTVSQAVGVPAPAQAASAPAPVAMIAPVSSTPKWILPALGVAAAGLLALLVLRKKR